MCHMLSHYVSTIRKLTQYLLVPLEMSSSLRKNWEERSIMVAGTVS